MAQELRITAGGAAVTASLHGDGDTTVVLGHGAGGDRRAALLVRLAEALAASGRRAVLYNFPYSEARRKVPDPPDMLEAACGDVALHLRDTLGPKRLVLGGKSMGGRIASQVVAKGGPADALVFVGYPLHPPGQPHRLRDRHLPAIRVPMLFLQGTRDAFARWDLIESVTGRLGALATLHRVEGADHGFGVPKRSGRTAAEVERALFQTVTAWLTAHGL